MVDGERAGVFVYIRSSVGSAIFESGVPFLVTQITAQARLAKSNGNIPNKVTTRGARGVL